MLHIWMEQNVLFYGMIGAGILGILCMFMVDRFYGRAIRDVRRITEPKGKWTKEFLNQYQMRLTKEQEINNPEAFVRTQLARGKTLGIGIQKWKQGIGYSAVLCFLLILTAVYGLTAMSERTAVALRVCTDRGGNSPCYSDEAIYGFYE